ncbi:MAG: type II secretion system protein GspG [Spartobacteria bacterium]|nr:type II secretion system protein GspG [Spartobacteria bacterium]
MKKRRKKQRRAQAGFTIMEVLVVLIIITILAGIVGVNVLPKLGESKVKAAHIQIKNLKAAVNLYRVEQNRAPDQSEGLQALVERPAGLDPKRLYPEGGYLDSPQVPMDPWGNAYIYLAPGRKNERFEIISYGADGEPGGENEDADISSSDPMP